MRALHAVGVGCVLVTVLAACGASSSSTPSTASSSAGSGGGVVVQVASSPVGSYLVDSSGHALYLFAADSPGHSACTGSCLTYWPFSPAPATLPAQLTGLTATLGVLARPDSGKQLTVDGLPAYTYSGDTSPGMTAGEGVNASGGLWWLITPAGHALTTAPSPSATSSGHGY